WPRELVLHARAAALLQGADDSTALDVYEQLRLAGAEDIAATLATARRDELLHARYAARLADAHVLAERGDLAGARAALEEVIGQGGGALEDWLLLARVRRELGDAAGCGAAAAHVLETASSGPLRVEALLLAGMSAQATRHD